MSTTIRTQKQHGDSLGARIVRAAAQTRTAPPARPRPASRDHEYVRDRAKALAVIGEQAEIRAEFARKLGLASGAVIGFRIFHAERVAEPARIGVRVVSGGGSWPPTAAKHVEPIERPTKRRGRPGRRGKLVAALARSRQL